MGMAKYTEAQKRAQLKYITEKTDDVRVRVPKGTKAEWKEAADCQGQSLQRYIIEAVEGRIARESNAATLPQAPVEASERPYSVFFRLRSDSPFGQGTFTEPSAKVVEASSEAEARVAFFDYLVSQMPGWELASRDSMILVMEDGEGNEEICEIVSVQ